MCFKSALLCCSNCTSSLPKRSGADFDGVSNVRLTNNLRERSIEYDNEASNAKAASRSLRVSGVSNSKLVHTSGASSWRRAVAKTLMTSRTCLSQPASSVSPCGVCGVLFVGTLDVASNAGTFFNMVARSEGTCRISLSPMNVFHVLGKLACFSCQA